MPVKTPTLINIPIDANPIEKTLTQTPETPETNDPTENPDQEEDIDPNAESAVLNSGAFGCMYFPGIRCNGELEDRGYITKIQKKTRVTDNEINISRRIRKKIRGYRNYFAPISKQCKVKMTKKYANDIRKCTLFQKEKDDEIERESFVSNKIRYLGNETIKTYLFNIASGNVDPTESQINSMGKLFWGAVIQTHLRLLTGVHLLLSAKIIHMDLKYGNIMMEPHNKQPIMIDFGISVDQKALSKAPSLSLPPEGGSVSTTGITTTPRSVFYVYDTYTAWCFDIFLCNYIVQVVQPTALDDTPTKEELESMMKEFQYGPLSKHAQQDTTRNDIFTTTLISKETIERFREKTIASFMATATTPKSWKQLYDQCVDTLYKTWDNYSIAAMYLGMLDILKYSKRDAFEQIETVQTASGKPFLEEYIHIIESVVYADPFHRPSVKDTMIRLHQLVKG
jgi:serine/threonine protein kinase